jgi:hypothetical protein
MMWGAQHLITLYASTACYGDSCTLLLFTNAFTNHDRCEMVHIFHLFCCADMLLLLLSRVRCADSYSRSLCKDEYHLATNIIYFLNFLRWGKTESTRGISHYLTCCASTRCYMIMGMELSL